MAPIQDVSVDDLKSKISTLEARIAQLESRLGGGQGTSASSQDGVRMILMGPPGAGKSHMSLFRAVDALRGARLLLTRSYRKGNTGSAAQG